jgi:hypothetical protein
MGQVAGDHERCYQLTDIDPAQNAGASRMFVRLC